MIFLRFGTRGFFRTSIFEPPPPKHFSQTTKWTKLTLFIGIDVVLPDSVVISENTAWESVRSEIVVFGRTQVSYFVYIIQKKTVFGNP